MKDFLFGSEKRAASRIVLGWMRLGQKTPSEAESFVKGALEDGINFWDNADIYGDGACEELAGEVFKRDPSLREKVILQSKCGIRREGGRPDGMVYFDFSKDHIIEAVEGSLSRMHTDHLDALLLHRPDVLAETDEIADAFSRLKKDGKVIDFGVSNMNPWQIRELQAKLDFPLVADQVQMSCAFTPMIDAALHVDMEDPAGVMRDGGILEYARMNDMAVQAWSSLQYGYFQGTFLGNDKFAELNKTLQKVGEEMGVSAMTAALAWILRIPGKMQAIVGTSRPDRMHEAAKAQEIVMSREDWYRIYTSAGNVLP